MSKDKRETARMIVRLGTTHAHAGQSITSPRQDASLQAGILVSAHALAFLKGPVSFGSEAPEILRSHDRRTARMLIRIGREDPVCEFARILGAKP